MSTAEGTYPKVGNDPVYASETNAINFCREENTEEAGPYNHTGDTNETTLRTYTVGGISGKGYKLVFLTFKASGSDDGYHDYYIKVNGEKWLCLVGSALEGSVTFTDGGVSIALSVDHEDVITITAKTSNSIGTVEISDIKFWTTDQDVTFTGS